MPSALDVRTAAIVIPLSQAERQHLEAWAHEQERECSQAIRWLLRDILTGAADSISIPPPATT